MIVRSEWPEFIRVPVTLFVLTGLGYGAWQERKRGYQNPLPWWERRR